MADSCIADIYLNCRHFEHLYFLVAVEQMRQRSAIMIIAFNMYYNDITAKLCDYIHRIELGLLILYLL